MLSTMKIFSFRRLDHVFKMRPLNYGQVQIRRPASGTSEAPHHSRKARSKVMLFCTLGASAAIFSAVGIGFYFRPDYREIHDTTHYYSNWKIRVYFSLPWNILSFAIGWLASVQIPTFLRSTILGTYAKVYDCRMDEAIHPEFEHYETFSQFFNRTLRPDVRPLSASPLVSPADGRILHFGRVEDGKIEFVKGKDYDIGSFLGDITNTKDEMELYQVVIYLAPGDYHAFHSPARWIAKESLHYWGLLLSVKPSIVYKIPHLFCLNERVVLKGTWKHGFFSLAAVAATNVGDISIAEIPSIRTNKLIRRGTPRVQPQVEEVHSAYLPGNKVGEFRLGSTIVLVFEGPPNLKFAIKAGDSVRYGQSLVADGC